MDCLNKGLLMHVNFIERNIRVRGGIQMFEKGKLRAPFFSFFQFFLFVFITDLAHNIDHSQSNQTCQSNPTLS